MRLPGENEERSAGLSVKYMAIGVSLCLLLILGVVIFTNKENEAKRKKAAEKETTVIALEHEQEGQDTMTTDAAAGMEETTAVGGLESGSGGNPAEASGSKTAGNGTDAAGNGETQSGQSTGGTPITGFAGRRTLQDIERLYKEHKLTAADLDFWDMYPAGEPEVESVVDSSADIKESEDGTEKKGNAKYEDKAQEEIETDPSKDGKHTLITYADGTEEWVLINPYLEKNTYDFTKLKMKSDKMAYYEDGKKTSYIGADISKYNNEVDFAALKESGIDYVMLRLGARGYGSGQILLDEKFTENITKATESGIDIGIYFFSQAITAEEAVEEANFVIQNLANYKITYPVVFDMEYVENDKARIEALSRNEKTTIAKAFLDTVKNAGYKPMVYGTKEWLIKQVDLTKLTGYDIWLSQQKDVPDYPYKFQMWQYTLEGDVNGVNGDADLNISFVDYSEK